MSKILFCFAFLIASTVFLATSQSASANGPRCEVALRNRDLLVREIRLGCETLKQCLVRRDTCVTSGLPTTQAKCEEVAECMLNRDAEFGDSAQCRYQWTKVGEDYVGGKWTFYKKCNLVPNPLVAQESCPGRILTSLTNIGLLYGGFLSEDAINFSSDLHFDCSAINNHYFVRIRTLGKVQQQVTEFCPQESESTRPVLIPVCRESQEFRPTPKGQYALPMGVNNNTQVPDGRNDGGVNHESGATGSGGVGVPEVESR